MKIIVANEQEKALIKRFLKAMKELDGVDTIVELDTETASGDEQYFEGDDRIFLEDAISYAVVEVDETVSDICVEHHHLTGTCSVCGTQTEGTEDGDDISYADYLEMTSPEAMKEWKCYECWQQDMSEPEGEKV